MLFFIGKFFSQSYNPSGQLFWEISFGSKKSYLWGTLHSNDKRLFAFPDSVFVAFHKSALVVVETDFFLAFEFQDVRQDEGTLTLDKRGKIYTSSNQPSKTFFGNEDGAPQFMDAWFQAKANLLGIPVKGLLENENPNLFDELDDFFTKKNRLLGKAESQVLCDYYLQGNLKKLEPLLWRNLTSSSGSFIDEVTIKNESLLTSIRSDIEKGNVFIALGIELLLGESGFLEELKQSGFKIRPINCSYSTSKTTEEMAIKANKNVELLCETNPGMLKATFPGKPWINEDHIEEKVITFKELGQGNSYRIVVMDKDSSITLTQYATIHIASPPYSPFFLGTMEDGTEYAQGISDSYPEGLKWVRIICSEDKVAVISCYGGNKFMNSDRPMRFFNEVVLD